MVTSNGDKTMKILKILNLSIIAAIFTIIILPFTLYSKEENAHFSYDILGIASEMNTWIEENNRKSLTRAWGYKLFDISPSPSLLIGKDGWSFYTPGNNVGIADGTFPLEQSQLDETVKILTNVKQYYELLGADFYFMSYPSKTSIYPEFVREGLSINKSPSDTLIEYITSKSLINAFTPKAALIEAKAKAKVYHKADVHTNDYGAYVTYKTICAEMSEHSGINMNPIEVTFAQGEYSCGNNIVAGVENIFGKSEIDPVAVYEANAHKVNEGELFDEIEEICTKGPEMTSGTSVRAIFENPAALNGTLLIYGTSMFEHDNIGESFQLTRYLAENFKCVILLGNGNALMPSIDDIVKPDYVLFERPERYTNIPNERLNLVPQVASPTEY
jgi:hypothetical protein